MFQCVPHQSPDLFPIIEVTEVVLEAYAPDIVLDIVNHLINSCAHEKI